MHLVRNYYRHWEFIRDLRNDPQVKHGFVNQEYITPKQHQEYMRWHNNDYYICLLRGVPVGYIGAVDNDIRLAVIKDAQRKGVARFMLEELMELYPQARAKVKIQNIVSQKFFESCGWKRTSKDEKYFYYDPKIDQA